MHLHVIGGTFDMEGGRPSGFVAKLIQELRQHHSGLFSHCNGGDYDELSEIIDNFGDDAVVIWMPNVSNDMDKVRDIKSRNPKVILVSAKNNYRYKDGQGYTFMEIVNHALSLKSNMLIEFNNAGEGHFNTRLIDPLGNVYHNGKNIADLAYNIIKRATQLCSMTRQGTRREGFNCPPVPHDEDFFKIVRENATRFHDLIHPADGVTRFLGNSSFRCEAGFPSIRGMDGYVYVSRRNLDKRDIGQQGFVPVYWDKDENLITYKGENKPSVDTPIQVRLYERYPQINYMLHSHVYVEGAPFTKTPIPCGALEEVDEIIQVVDAFQPQFDMNDSYFAVNLRGHGSIVAVNTLDKFQNVNYYARPVPEQV